MTPHGALVLVDDKPLNPRTDIANHSPEGFAWGYMGSGPAQLALAILADHLGEAPLPSMYQDFKVSIVAREWPLDTQWRITGEEINEWLVEYERFRYRAA